MTKAKERVLALKFLEKQKKHPEYAKKIGINIKFKKQKYEKGT